MRLYTITQLLRMLNDNAKNRFMKEYEVEIVTELDEVEIFRVIAASPNEAEIIASNMVVRGETDLYGREVISACAL